MKTAKRLLTLALALCMLLGIPFAVSAADDFQVVSAVEAPYTYDWESVVWDNDTTGASSTKSAADFKAKWLGKAVIVTFNHALSSESLENLKSQSICRPIVTAKGATVTDGYLPGLYLGYSADAKSIIFAHSAAGYNTTNANSIRTFDQVRAVQTPDNFVVSFNCPTDTNKDDHMDVLTDVDGYALRRNPGHQFPLTERNPLTVESVTPLADSKITNADDKGHIWLVKFNQNIDPSIKTSTGKILMWVTDAKGDRLNGTYETCRIVANYCSDTVLAIRPNSATYTVSYYEDLAAQNETTIGGYGVEFIDGLGSSNRNNCVDSILSVSGETLPLVTTGNSGDSWISAMFEPFDAKIGDANYKTFAEAMAAAKSGETVTMLNDAVNAGPVFVLNANVNLDLNGHTLTAENFMAFGHVTDSTDGEGKLIIGKDKYTDLLANNEAMPLYDGNGYRFFDYEFLYRQNVSPVAGANQYAVRLAFNKAKAYELLAANDDLKIGVNMTVTKDEGKVQHVNYVFSDNTMNEYAAQSAADMTKTKAIILTVHGVDGLNLTAQSSLTSPTRIALGGELVMAQ